VTRAAHEEAGSVIEPRLATLLSTELMRAFKSPGDLQQVAREIEE